MELDLLCVLQNRENYDKFCRFVDDNSLTEHARVIVKSMGRYFEAKASEGEIDWGKFRTYFMFILHPSLSPDKKSLYNRIFDRLEDHEVDEDTRDELLRLFIGKDVCSELVAKVLDNDGLYDLEALRELLEEGLERQSESDKEEDDDHDLEDLVSKLVTTGGIPLKLTEYKESIGKIRAGDMVVIAGRPESGKTSHVIDQFVMPVLEADQDHTCLFFNNEEDGDKIRLRAYQTALGKTGVDIARDVPGNKAAYSAKIGTRFKVIDDPMLTVGKCEALCKKHKPKVVVFNVLDKVYGFSQTSSNDVDRVRRLAQWARQVAKRYDAVVVCICQADASAEGERFFDKSKVYGSKTGIPGEADILICLGHSHDIKDKDKRFINIAKNKTTGDASVDPSKSHNQFVCSFNGATGRFTDA